jgi:hypothetical protein
VDGEDAVTVGLTPSGRRAFGGDVVWWDRAVARCLDVHRLPAAQIPCVACQMETERVNSREDACTAREFADAQDAWRAWRLDQKVTTAELPLADKAFHAGWEAARNAAFLSDLRREVDGGAAQAS